MAASAALTMAQPLSAKGMTTPTWIIPVIST
jgi:hypothetical protein